MPSIFRTLITKFKQSEKPDSETAATQLKDNQTASTLVSSDELRSDLDHTELRHFRKGDILLDHYKVEQVRSGGMGHVYITHHDDWDVKVAIKAPNEKMLQDNKRLTMVVREAENWNDLGMHPNIAYCYFVRKVENVPHIFIEYIDDGTLTDWIVRGRCKDLNTTLDLAIQFCHGMAYAHSKGLIHRDIKPDNILVNADGTLKITDFGIAHRVKVDDDGKIIEQTQEGSSGLTPSYASPEQYTRPQDVSFESDIFSFGLCLWEMLFGLRPYSDFPYARIKQPVSVPELSARELPDAFNELLVEITAFETEDRRKIGGFATLRDKLKEIYHKLNDSTAPHSDLEKIDLEADGLCNQGVSFLELGKHKEARDCFEKALENNPTHLQTTYNLGLIEWRSGEIDDMEFLMRLDNCKEDTSAAKGHGDLLAKVHMERLNPLAAKEALKNDQDRVEKLFQGDNDTVSEIITIPHDGFKLLDINFAGSKALVTTSYNGALNLFDIENQTLAKLSNDTL